MKRVGLILLGLMLAAGVVIATLFEPPTSAGGETAAPAWVYVGPQGKKYHAQECSGLKHTRAADIARLSRADADARGLAACHDCFRR